MLALPWVSAIIDRTRRWRAIMGSSTAPYCNSYCSALCVTCALVFSVWGVTAESFDLKSKKYNVSTLAVIPFVDNTSSNLGPTVQNLAEETIKRDIRRFTVTPSFKMRTIINENKLFVGSDKTIDLVALKRVSDQYMIDLFIIGNVIEVGESLTVLFRFIFGRTLEELQTQRLKVEKGFDENELRTQIGDVLKQFVNQLPYHGLIDDAMDPTNIAVKLGRSYVLNPGDELQVIEIMGTTQHPIHRHVTNFESRIITTLAVKSIKGDLVYAVNNDALAVEKDDLVRIPNPIEATGGMDGTTPDEGEETPTQTGDDDLLLPPKKQEQKQERDPLADPLAEVSVEDALVDKEEAREEESSSTPVAKDRMFAIGPDLGLTFYSYTLRNGVDDGSGFFPYIIPLNFFTRTGIRLGLELNSYFQFDLAYGFGFFKANVKIEGRGNINDLFININDLEASGVAKYPLAVIAGDNLEAGLRLGYSYNSIHLGKVFWYEADKAHSVYVLPTSVHSPVVGLLAKIPLGMPMLKAELGGNYWFLPTFEEEPLLTGSDPSTLGLDYFGFLSVAFHDNVSLQFGYKGRMLSTSFSGQGSRLMKSISDGSVAELYHTVLLTLFLTI